MRIVHALSVPAFFTLLSIAAPAVMALPTFNDFEGGGTPFTVTTGTAPAAAVITASNGNDFLRLVTQQTNNRNTVGFDRTEVGNNFNQLKVDWDFRMFKNNTTGDQRMGDGYSFGLLPTATYGTTGALPGSATGDASPEVWNLPGALVVNFLGFNGTYDARKDVALRFNDVQIGATVNSPVDFTFDARPILDPDANVDFVHAQLLINALPGGGSNVSFLLGGTTATGSGTPIFNNVFIAGLNPYEWRVGFSGRNGSAINFTDIDNVSAVIVVPEPATATLGLLSFAGLMLRRRRAA